MVSVLLVEADLGKVVAHTQEHRGPAGWSGFHCKTLSVGCQIPHYAASDTLTTCFLPVLSDLFTFILWERGLTSTPPSLLGSLHSARSAFAV